jgi:hypothetical protein
MDREDRPHPTGYFLLDCSNIDIHGLVAAINKNRRTAVEA